MEDVKLMLYRVKENAEGALGFIAQIEGISRLPGSASAATEAASCGKEPIDVIRDLYFEAWDKQRSIQDLVIDRLATDHETHVQTQMRLRRDIDAAHAKLEGREPGAGGRRRPKTRSKRGGRFGLHMVTEAQARKDGGFWNNERVWIDWPVDPPSPRPRR